MHSIRALRARASKGTMMATPAARIEHLKIALPEGADRALAVDDVSFDLVPGEILCIVGESGSGKSMSANAMMGLLPDLVRPVGGRILVGDKDILTLSDKERRDMRGRAMAMIFQEPMSALNPLMKVADQIAEVYEAHGLLTPRERKDRAVQLLTEVGIPEPEKAARAYPFQLSGGQRQRVMIAMALALEPKILIADEPTTALDVTTQAQILDLIRHLQRERDMAVMFITHDFGVVAEIADRVAVMQFGKIVEEGSVDDVLDHPQHDYTRKLIAAIPRLSADRRAAIEKAPILAVEGLNKTYHTGGSMFAKGRVVHAVNDVSFVLADGETLGIVGESGSGKSSVGRCLVRLLDPDSGVVKLGGVDMAYMKGEELRRERKRIQMIFQDPYASLNPRSRVGRILSEGPMAHGKPKDEAYQRASELLELVGLDASAIDRYPHEFSGGQRQRIGIARALALEPEVIIADEAVSALDVSIQAQVLDLLADLKARLNLALVFITHDLRVAAQVCDRIAVMQKGRIVELGPAYDIFNDPRDAYTRSLIEAIPGREKELAAMTG